MGRKKMEMIDMTTMTSMTTIPIDLYICNLSIGVCHACHTCHIYPIVIPKIANCNT